MTIATSTAGRFIAWSSESPANQIDDFVSCSPRVALNNRITRCRFFRSGVLWGLADAGIRDAGFWAHEHRERAGGGTRSLTIGLSQQRAAVRFADPIGPP